MNKLTAWLTSFRLHTLPLAISCTVLGSFLAAHYGQFHWNIAIGAVLTTLFLQILSNLANDYGDMKTGVDDRERLGPRRGLQSGRITRAQMKRAILLFVLFSLLSGSWLIYEAFATTDAWHMLAFFLLGCGAILAAIKYTMGKNPYGYSGFGDVFVFLFFGLVGVLGTFFLHTQTLGLKEWLPAIAIGCFSTGVLNLNNLRDELNDTRYQKRTLVVQWGAEKAKFYHLLLLRAGMLAGLTYVVLIPGHPWKYLILLPYIGLFLHGRRVWNNTRREELNQELRNLSLLTMLFAICLGLGILI